MKESDLPSGASAAELRQIARGLDAMANKLDGSDDTTKQSAPEPQMDIRARKNFEEPEIIAERILAARRERHKYLDSSLFGEPAWEILLYLYVEAHNRRVVSVGNCCSKIDAHATTILRWIDRLEDLGLVARQSFSDKAKEAALALSERGLTAINKLLRSRV